MATTDDQKNWPVVPWHLLTEPEIQYIHIDFGRNWNIVRHIQGLGGLMFACSSGGNVDLEDDDPDEDMVDVVVMDDVLVDQDEIEVKECNRQ